MKKVFTLTMFLIAFQFSISQTKIEIIKIEKINCLNESNTKVHFKIKCESAKSILVGIKGKDGKLKYLKTINTDSEGNAIYIGSGLKVNQTFEYGFYVYSHKGKINRLKINDSDYTIKSVFVSKKCK